MAKKTTPKLTVSNDALSQPSIPLAGASPVVIKKPSALAAMDAKRWGLNIMVDLSGSVMVLHEPVQEQVYTLINMLLSDPGLAERVRVCLTLMSAKVVTTGYEHPRSFAMPPILPGGTSPLGAMLACVCDTDDADRADEQKIYVAFTDGVASDRDVLEAAIGRLRQQQEEHGTEVFVVALERNPNLEVIRRLAVNPEREPVFLREPKDAPAVATIFEAVCEMLRLAAKRDVPLASVRSLTLAELEEAAALAGK